MGGFIFAWDISWAGLMFVVIAEVLPTRVRSWGMGMAICVFWSLSFLVGETLESMFNAVPPYGAKEDDKQKHPAGTFFLYAVTSALAFVFVFFYVPETGNKSLEAQTAGAAEEGFAAADKGIMTPSTVTQPYEALPDTELTPDSQKYKDKL